MANDEWCSTLSLRDPKVIGFANLQKEGATTMSDDGRSFLPFTGRLKFGALALAAMLAVSAGSGSLVSAQDATPSASPVATCDAPALPPGTPTAEGEGPSASPMAEMATPMPEAPAAEASPVAGTPAEGDTAAAIEAAAANLAGCVNTDLNGAAALMTTNFLEMQFGSANPYDAVSFMEGTTFADFTMSNPMTYPDGSVSVDTQYMSSQYQLSSERWYLVQDGDYWKIDNLGFNAPNIDLDTAVVGVNLVGPTDEAGSPMYAIEPNASSVVASPALILHAINAGTAVHELDILQLPEGKTLDDAFSGAVSESDIQFIGSIGPLAPGEEADLTLINLPPGTYTLACFITGPDGKPHAMNGMTTQFEVTAAS